MLHRAISGLAALLIITSGTAFAQDAKPAETEKKSEAAAEQQLPEGVEQFQDWIKECETVKGPDGQEIELCQISQTLTNTEINQPMMKVAVGYVPDKTEAVMVVTLPLGVILPPGIQLEVGDGKAARVPINTCLPSGCQAGVQLDKEFTERLKKGKTLEVSFAAPNGQAVKAPISLSGFTAGLGSLKVPVIKQKADSPKK
jgi:invasion protein IalB